MLGSDGDYKAHPALDTVFNANLAHHSPQTATLAMDEASESCKALQTSTPPHFRLLVVPPDPTSPPEERTSSPRLADPPPPYRLTGPQAAVCTGPAQSPLAARYESSLFTTEDSDSSSSLPYPPPESTEVPDTHSEQDSRFEVDLLPTPLRSVHVSSRRTSLAESEKTRQS